MKSPSPTRLLLLISLLALASLLALPLACGSSDDSSPEESFLSDRLGRSDSSSPNPSDREARAPSALPGSQQELEALAEEARNRPDYCDEYVVNILGSREAPPPECETPRPPPTATPELEACPSRPATLPMPAETSAETDREALVVVFNATDGPTWDNSGYWNSMRPLGEWPGVTVDEEGRVVQLGLQFPETTVVEIPPELGNLAKLTTLNIRGAQVTGAIPAELGHLSHLQELALGHRLCGAIPAELGNLADLQKLDLSGNELTGEIPPELGDLPGLKLLNLDSNQLTGEIPGEYERPWELLNLWRNEITGCVSTYLEVYLSIEDGFPICDASDPEDAKTLVAIYQAVGDPGWNGWLGRTPIGRWAGVKTDRQGRVVQLELNLGGAEIPLELGNLSNLEYLTIRDIGTQGELPSEMAGLVNLKSGYFGIHPESPGLCKGDQFRDNDAFRLISCHELEALLAVYDALDENIWAKLGVERPSGIYNPTSIPGAGISRDGNGIGHIKLLGETLTGTLSAEVGNLKDLVELDLRKGQLTGEIPAELGNLENLVYLNLSENQLSGEIPAELGNLVKMERMYLSDNLLTGEIPEELGNLVLATGQYKGDWGSTITRGLFLYGNQLTGCVPNSIQGIHIVSRLPDC